MTQVLVNGSNGYGSIVEPREFGFDGGNDGTAATTFDENGHELSIALPSAVIPVTSNKQELLNSANHGANTYDSYRQPISVKYRGQLYTVGFQNYVQRREVNPQRGMESRYTSPEQVVRLLAASGLLIDQAEYSLELVTTLPLRFYSAQLRKAVKNALEGEHEFLLNGMPRKAIIRVRKVMIEGLPAISLYGANSAKTMRILIDGGMHTTEYLLLNGYDVVADRSSGSEVGVQLIADYLYDRVLEMYNRRLISLEISETLRAYGSRLTGDPQPYPEIACGSYVMQAQDLHLLVSAGAKNLANEVMNNAGSLWGSANDIIAGEVVHQYLVGGASYFIAEELQRKMPRLLPVAKAELANARGSAHVARAIIRG